MMDRRPARQAFTLVELLVVIGIIAILIAVLLPALNRARQQSLKVACASNLRVNGQACFNYAANNKGKLPNIGPGPVGAHWPWDISLNTRDAMVKYGASRHTMYCPVFSEQDADGAWTYTQNDSDPTNDICVAGYIWIIEKEGQVNIQSGALAGWWPIPPFLLAVDERTKPQRKLLSKIGEKRATELELSADAILSQNAASGPFTVAGGFTTTEFRVHRTNHLDKNGWPLGGNTLYLDGHVEWKDFPVGLVKANNLAASPIRPHWAFNGNTAPYFWW